jgi:hypothetical protein
MALCPSATMIRPTAPTPTPRSWLREGRSPRKAVSQAESNAPTVKIQILSFNNFHGEPRAAKRVQRLHHHRSQDRPRRGMAVDVTTEAGASNVSPPTCVTPATETPTP